MPGPGGRLTPPSGLRFRWDNAYGTVDNSGARRTATSMLAGSVMTPVTARVVTFDAATMRGSRLSDSIFAGMTTDTPMVIAVMATAAIPKATCGIDVS